MSLSAGRCGWPSTSRRSSTSCSRALASTPACSNAPPAQWYATEIACASYDPEAAAAALDEAGWVVDAETGARVKDGKQMRIRMCTSSGNPLRLTTLGRIAQDWAAIGVGADIQTRDVYFDHLRDLTSPPRPSATSTGAPSTWRCTPIS